MISLEHITTKIGYLWKGVWKNDRLVIQKEPFFNDVDHFIRDVRP